MHGALGSKLTQWMHFWLSATRSDKSFYNRNIFVDVSTSDEKTDVGEFWNKLYIRDTILFADGSTSEWNKRNRIKIERNGVANLFVGEHLEFIGILVV